MRVFTLVGAVLTVLGLALVVVALLPSGPGITGEVTGMGAGIAALTLLPMGIVFMLVGIWASRLTGARRRLLKTGIPGQATVLSVNGGNIVVNNINTLLTFRLRVAVPGHPPYEVEHRQLTSLFAMAALQVGSTVPVMVDPADPRRLTIDVAGEASAAAARAARPVTNQDWPTDAPACAMPNTLSTMGDIAPNTIMAGAPEPGPPPIIAGSWGVASKLPDPTTIAAITHQLSRLGISVDPALLAGGQLTMDSTTLDLRPGVQGSVLSSGHPGSASIRAVDDTGVNVRGESLLRLDLDVTPQGGTVYRVQTGSLVPETARARATPGAVVPVRVDPAHPTNVVIDWGAAG